MAHRIWLVVRLSGDLVMGCEVVPANVVMGRRGVELSRPRWAEALMAEIEDDNRDKDDLKGEALRSVHDEDDLSVFEPLDDADDPDVLPPVDGDWSQALYTAVGPRPSSGDFVQAEDYLGPSAAEKPWRQLFHRGRGLPIVVPIGDLAGGSIHELAPLIERAAATVRDEDRDVVFVAAEIPLTKIPWIVDVPTHATEPVAVVLLAPTDDAR